MMIAAIISYVKTLWVTKLITWQSRISLRTCAFYPSRSMSACARPLNPIRFLPGFMGICGNGAVVSSSEEEGQDSMVSLEDDGAGSQGADESGALGA